MQVPDTLTALAVPIDDVHPYEHNPRRGDLAALTESLEVNGQYRPIVANRRTGDDELDAADDAVLLEVQRVDRLHTALWPRAVKGDLGALDRLMRLSERRLALLEKARLNDTPPHAGTVSISRASTGAAATR